MDKNKVINTRHEARDFAIDWMSWQEDQNLSYGELAEWQSVFTELAKKFHLTEEFEENGII